MSLCKIACPTWTAECSSRVTLNRRPEALDLVLWVTSPPRRDICLGPSPRAGEPFALTQNGSRPFGQVLRCAAVLGPVAYLFPQVVLRLTEMSLSLTYSH